MSEVMSFVNHGKFPFLCTVGAFMPLAGLAAGPWLPGLCWTGRMRTNDSTISEGLEGGLSGGQHWLLLQGIQPQFLAPTWQLRTVWNSSSVASSALSWLFGHQAHGAQICMLSEEKIFPIFLQPLWCRLFIMLTSEYKNTQKLLYWCFE